MTDPSLRRAIDAVREHDAPGDVDREALLKKILAAPPTPVPAASKTLPLAGASLVAVALLGALVWRSAPPTSEHHTTPRVTTSAPQIAPSAPRVVPGAPRVTPGAPRATPSVPQVAPSTLSSHVSPVREAPAALRGAHAGPRRDAPPTAEADEWRILRDAEAALRAHDPTRALQILGQHTTQLPHGVAAPEVMAYRVRAYCMAGRVDEARATARELRARAPVSPAAYSLRATCVSDR